MLAVALALSVLGFAVPQDERILVFTKTAGFRHDSIGDGVAAFVELSERLGFSVTVSQDYDAFTDRYMARYAAVVFLNTTGDVLDDAQQAAFERYIRAGGGYIGVHAATDTEYDWPWYGRLAGAYFDGHPRVQEATLNVVEASHPATRSLPQTWVRTDEWYDFRSINPDLNVLITIDETSYDGGKTGEPHPVAWYHEFEGGRAFYTALGHTRDSYTDPAFLEHLAGGVLWVLDR